MARIHRTIKRLIAANVPARKNYVLISQLGIAIGSNSSVSIVQPTNALTGASGQVITGSSVKAIYLELYFSAQSVAANNANQGTFLWSLQYVPNGAAPISTNNLYATASSFVEANVIQSGVCLVYNRLGTAGTGFNVVKYSGWIKIPPRFQKLVTGNSIQLQVFNGVSIMDMYGAAIFKSR